MEKSEHCSREGFESRRDVPKAPRVGVAERDRTLDFPPKIKQAREGFFYGRKVPHLKKIIHCVYAQISPTITYSFN